MVAVPLWPPGMKCTLTCPLVVRASVGSIRPSVVVKETSVPFWTGVPAPAVVVVVVPVVPVVPVPVVPVPLVPDPLDAVATPFSITVAMISTLPSTGTVDAPEKSVMTVPVGASSGTLSHDEVTSAAKRTVGTIRQARRAERRECVSMGSAKDNTLMYLQRQDNERGYAMAALLVTLAVMSVLLSAALPAWRHEAQREKEAELVFRGEQYARAVALYRAKNQNAFPPSVDVLVQGKFLRKKYLDPVTNKDFDLIGAGTQMPANPGTPAAGGTRGSTPAARAAPSAPSAAASIGAGGSSMVSGGIMGVHSKSQETSIRIYKGQSRYDQWNFVFTALNRPGDNDPGALNPGGRGGSTLPGANGGRGRGVGADTGRGGRGTTPGRGSGGFGPPSSPSPITFPPGRGGAGS